MSKDNNQDDDRTESLGDLGNRPDRPRLEHLGHFRIDATLGTGGMISNRMKPKKTVTIWPQYGVTPCATRRVGGSISTDN